MAGTYSFGEESEYDLDLPERLFATDRFPAGRLNIYSKVDLLAVVVKSLKGTPEFSILKDSAFGKLFDLPVRRCPVSLKLLHALISRQVVTKKKYEFWTVFGGYPMRFSLVEFAMITGLNCREFPEGYYLEDDWSNETSGTYWEKLIGSDKTVTLGQLKERLETDENMPGWRKLGIALILIVDGVLIAKNQIGRPTPKYVEMLADVESFLEFPWGRESYIHTISCMIPVKRRTSRGKDPVDMLRAALQQQTFRVIGFPLVLQLWALQAIPLLLAKVPDVSDCRSFMDVEYKTRGKFTLLAIKDVLEVENDTNLKVMPMLKGNHMDRDEWTEWEDEVKDKKVRYLLSLIKQGHVFKKGVWYGGDASLPLYVHGAKGPPRGQKRRRVIPKSHNGTKNDRLGVREGGNSSMVDQCFKLVPPFTDQQVAWIEEKLDKMKGEIMVEIKKLKRKMDRLAKRRRRSTFWCTRRLSSRRIYKRKRRGNPMFGLEDSPQNTTMDIDVDGEETLGKLAVLDEQLKSQGMLVEKKSMELLSKEKELECVSFDLKVKEKRVQALKNLITISDEELDLKSKELEEIHKEVELKKQMRKMISVFVTSEKHLPATPNNDTNEQNGADETEDGIIHHETPASLTHDEVSSLLRALPNPSEYVLELVQDDIISEGSGLQESFVKMLVLIFEELDRVQPMDKSQMQLKATKVATLWKEKITIEAPKSSLEALAFLLFIVAYGLKTLINEEETALLASSVAQYEQAPRLFNSMNLNPREFSKELIKKRRYIPAVRVICSFKLDKEFEFSPSKLLMEEIIILRSATESSKAKEKDVGRLKAILELVADYKLEINLPGDLIAMLMI